MRSAMKCETSRAIALFLSFVMFTTYTNNNKRIFYDATLCKLFARKCTDGVHKGHEFNNGMKDELCHEFSAS